MCKTIFSLTIICAVNFLFASTHGVEVGLGFALGPVPCSYAYFTVYFRKRNHALDGGRRIDYVKKNVGNAGNPANDPDEVNEQGLLPSPRNIVRALELDKEAPLTMVDDEVIRGRPTPNFNKQKVNLDKHEEAGLPLP
jgi:hypothetical protein